MKTRKLYKITFLDQGKTLELYARRVDSSALWGFTEVAELVFDEAREGIVVDPTEERLRERFGDTRALHLPIQSIVRVEEVDKRAPLTIRDTASGDKITPFPLVPPKIR